MCECVNWLERQMAGLPARCDEHAAKMKLVGAVYEDPHVPVNVKRAIYQASDGFGPDPDPDVYQWDRSAVRDSGPEGVEQMWTVAFAYTRPDFTKVVLGIPFSWESQAHQHPLTCPEGFRYEEVEVIEGYPIDDLTYYDEKGNLVGILYRYPLGAPGFEVPMAINLYVKPSERRKGIATKLLREAERRWGPIRWDRQRFTREGAALVRNYLREGG